jgi:hypothetical protein
MDGGMYPNCHGLHLMIYEGDGNQSTIICVHMLQSPTAETHRHLPTSVSFLERRKRKRDKAKRSEYSGGVLFVIPFNAEALLNYAIELEGLFVGSFTDTDAWFRRPRVV